MPRLWFVTTSQHGSPLPISFTDFSTAFGDKAVRLLPGTADASSMGSQRVLLEVGANETKLPIFMRPGYYLVEGLSSAAAETALHKLGIVF